MEDIIFWIYFLNAIFLISHEVESAYWKEWKLFKMKGDVTEFLLIHFPLWFILLYGLIAVYENTSLGYWISIAISFAGIFAFLVHMYFIKKGNKEFTLPISKYILSSTLVLSLAQLYLTISLLFF